MVRIDNNPLDQALSNKSLHFYLGFFNFITSFSLFPLSLFLSPSLILGAKQPLHITLPLVIMFFCNSFQGNCEPTLGLSQSLCLWAGV